MSDFEYKGVWWLPTSPEQQIPGILKYSISEGATLSLIGSFDRHLETFDLILGFTDKGKRITLYNSFVIQRAFSLPGMDTVNIYSNYVFIGTKHIEDISELKFQRAIIQLKNFDEWVNDSSGFSIDENFEDKEILIKYKLPKGHEAKVNSRFKLEINPTAKGPGWNIIQKEAKITQNINAVFTYYKRKTFNNILSDIQHFENFLTLCSQRTSYPISFYLLNKDSDKKYTERYEVYYEIHIDERKERGLTPFDFLIQFNSIKPIFNTIIQNWYVSKNQLNTCYIPYFNNFYGKQLYTSDKYLNICRAIEAFHRDTSNASGTHFKQRVYQTINNIKSCCNFLLNIRNYNKFSEKVKNYRNDFTHSNQSNVSLNKKYLETHTLTEKLTIILTAAILDHIGIPKGHIKTGYLDTRLYTYLRKRK